VAPVAWNGRGAAPAPAAAATRDVWAADGWEPYAVVERDALAPGDVVAERTIVEQEDTTVVVPAGWHGRVAEAEILVLERLA
jgi:N-methylhydantoinase A